MRWRHPIWGLLLPDSFIGVAESTNLAGELGRWVMRSACAESADGGPTAWAKAMLRINVSPVELITRGFVHSVADTIDEFGIDGGSVCLEITERAVVHDIETTRKTSRSSRRSASRSPSTTSAPAMRFVAPEVASGGHAQDRHRIVRDLGTKPGIWHCSGDHRACRGVRLQLVAEGVETPLPH